MTNWLQARFWLLIGSLLIILTTSAYLTFVVLPRLGQPAPALIGGLVHSDAQDLGGADGGDFPRVRLGGWSAVAMLALLLPLTVGLGLAVTNRGRDLSPTERAIWLAISLISLGLFFFTANVASTFVGALLG